jgi:cytochrome P450
LKSSRLKRLESILQKHAERELAVLLERGSGNMSTEFGATFCARVEQEWLNLDEDDSAALAANVNPFVQSWRTGDWDAVKKSSDGFYEIARRVLAARDGHLLDPDEDPASSLLMERDADGNPLDQFNLM